jgi:hypothetical protein
MFENLKPTQELFFMAIVAITAAVAFYRGKQINDDYEA